MSNETPIPVIQNKAERAIWTKFYVMGEEGKGEADRDTAIANEETNNVALQRIRELGHAAFERGKAMGERLRAEDQVSR